PPTTPPLNILRIDRPYGFCCINAHQQDPAFLRFRKRGGFLIRRDTGINRILSPGDFRVRLSL
ncbi:hypothetical protein, partial [Escherichia coli]|uniref:hypothetical protein n=1 Tax=Escherichia coli TaxID=562 RepID=UPI003D18A167